MGIDYLEAAENGYGEATSLPARLVFGFRAAPPSRRAATATVVIRTHFNTKQQVFLDFVLLHYVSVGVDELDQEKLTPLLRLKYHDSIADAVADLGRPEEIGRAFTGFQRYLYHRPQRDLLQRQPRGMMA